jgi:hypothetical protein
MTRKSKDLVDCLEHAHSLDEFIDLGKSIMKYDYAAFSMYTTIDGVPYSMHNVIDDYIDDLKDASYVVNLTPEQVKAYEYNPKKLSFKLYETTLFHYLILKLNDLCSSHDFDIKNKTLLLLKPADIKSLLGAIYNEEHNAIMVHNNAHLNDTAPNNISNDRLSGTK